MSEENLFRENEQEAIRLVIWDLDETFWDGTLTEGGISPREENISLVKSLSKRGIVSSISSKNDFDEAKAELEKLGIWDHFIFPQIAFASKGPMIRNIVEATNLRPKTIMFIDDNPMNLNEALFLYPDLQVAAPSSIAHLESDSRFKGKPDPQMERLGRYKILENKKNDKKNDIGNNNAFLKQSRIRISFHYDIQETFPRIHDLVNRTNQLNFTKNRWPEDEEGAKEAFHKDFSERFPSVSGYVKVSDKYGNYGICGFFLISGNIGKHFLFSCRVMSMGVEQFCWAHLRNPHIQIAGDVVSQLDNSVDWIEIVDDVDKDDNFHEKNRRVKVCLRGACDFTSMEHYFRNNYTVIGEFPQAYKSWSISPWARTIAASDIMKTESGQKLLNSTTIFPDHYLDSAINSGEADIYVLSFSVEYASHLYRSRSTGIVLSMCNDYLSDREFSATPYSRLVEKFGRDPGFSENEWTFMQKEFEFFAHHDLGMFTADVCHVFEKIKKKKVIILVLNESVGSSEWIKSVYREINRIVVPLAKTYGFDLVDYRNHVRNVGDLASEDDHGVHFSREVYLKMANDIMTICDSYVRNTLG
ncbi:MAG: HAD-IIIC family phosphatase [Gluconacetobacter sp.]